MNKLPFSFYDMELELGLALPCNHFPTNIIGNVGFDMRKDSFDEKKQKLCFAEANEEIERKTLSLFIWNDQPNEKKKRPFKACDKDTEEENQIVVWPPINTWRKKQFHQGCRITNDRNNIVGGRNSMYVKVKMEGVPIGRKVDLRLYDSYHILTHNLLQMFSKYKNLGNNSTCFTILYQDREGDWMLAGDVPWKTFVETVQRIEIQKNEK